MRHAASHPAPRGSAVSAESLIKEKRSFEKREAGKHSGIHLSGFWLFGTFFGRRVTYEYASLSVTREAERYESLKAVRYMGRSWGVPGALLGRYMDVHWALRVLTSP